MFDQDVTRPDFLNLQKLRPRKFLDVFWRQLFRWVPYGLLRLRIEEIRHLSCIRKTNFPSRLFAEFQHCLYMQGNENISTYHASWIGGSEQSSNVNRELWLSKTPHHTWGWMINIESREKVEKVPPAPICARSFQYLLYATVSSRDTILSRRKNRFDLPAQHYIRNNLAAF